MEERKKASAPITIALVRKLLHRGARSNLGKIFSRAYAVDVARILASLGASEREMAFAVLREECGPDHVSAILSEMAAEDSVALLEGLPPAEIAGLLSSMPADDATHLASRLDDPLAGEVLKLMEAQPAAVVRVLLEHEERTAGRIMTPDVFALEEDVTVSEAITALQKRSSEFEMVFYVYVVDRRNHVVGVVSLKQILTTPPSAQLKRIMTPDVITVHTSTSQEEVARKVAEYNLLSIPVVDDEDCLVGMVTVDDVIDVLHEEVGGDLLALAGVAAAERVSTPAWRSIRLRLPWLLVNLCTAFVASYVVSRFEGPIRAFTPLAVLMPIVAGVGGNASTQAVTVIIRGMALNEMTGVGWAVVKQVLVGAGNGFVVGIVCATAAALFYDNFWLGVILATAMVINLVIGGLAGTLVPIGLRRLHFDPAVSSSVFVTMCTDVGGFFTFLGLASLLIHLLLR